MSDDVESLQPLSLVLRKALGELHHELIENSIPGVVRWNDAGSKFSLAAHLFSVLS